jgi:error-prone DNA polymerase
MVELPAYAELHCLSNFSFLRGASHPEELVARAKELGYSALALTDECSVAGVVRAHVQARTEGLKLLIGSEFALADGPRIVLLAPDRAAYGDLSELITRGRRGAKKGSYHLTRDDVAAHAGRCLALWRPDEVADSEPLGWLRDIFPDRLWIAVERVLSGRDQERLAHLQALSERFAVPCVATGGVQMHERGRKRMHDVLTAIRLGTTVQAAGHALAPNGERCLRARTTLARLYPSELLEESTRIAARCTFSLDELRYEYPDEIVPAGETPASYLRKLTEDGAKRRWPQGVKPQVRNLIERELALIAELKYEPFFLTVCDVVKYARDRDILCQGRGSAANSVVCFCLGITEVDPAKIDTLFERFVSKERNEPPDIDVDFEHERREEVIQYVYAKYGRHRAALAATLITYRTRSAVRDVGKALGFSLEQVDRLAKNFQWWDEGEADASLTNRISELTPPLPPGEGWGEGDRAHSVFSQRLREAGFDPENPRLIHLVEMVRAIRGFPRHLSQHVGGFVIARDSLSRLVPIENAAMPERTVIQWDKNDIDALGLLKVDCLGLGMLTVIRKAFELIKAWDGRKLTIEEVVSKEDPAVYEMICHADTVGVFQIESRAQMSMLPRLKPRRFYDLVIEIAIVRPGPIQGNMVHPYLRRRQKLEPVHYPSDAVRAVLERTLGVPIFQEQVIKLAMVAAGFSAGEADGLRRAMAAWSRKGGLEPYERRLIDGMRQNGYPEQFARQIFEQIKGFGEYGFPESHSASFALLAYTSAWLKYYEPAIFLAAILNSQPMGFYQPAQLIQDARRHKVEVRPVDVRFSDWDCTLERMAGTDKAVVRLGLRHVKGLSEAGAGRLVAARALVPFDGVPDIVRRARLDRRDRDALASAGALKGLAGHRHRARWAVAGIEPERPLLARTSISEAIPLLRVPTEGENVVADYAHLGFTLGRHPLALLRGHLAKQGSIPAEAVRALPHGQDTRTAGIVVCRQHPGSAKGVIFLTLEDETGQTNVVVWPNLVARYQRILTQARLLFVDGEVQREGEVLHVVARRLQDCTAMLGAIITRSRDFH